MSTEAPAVYNPSPFPTAVHQAARHRASGGNFRLPLMTWIVLTLVVVALVATGVVFAL